MPPPRRLAWLPPVVVRAVRCAEVAGAGGRSVTINSLGILKIIYRLAEDNWGIY